MKTIEIEKNSKIAPFYVVWVEDGCRPIKKHNTAIEASAEAHRLCEKEHADAYILKCVGGYEFCQGFADIEVTDTPVENEEESTKR